MKSGRARQAGRYLGWNLVAVVLLPSMLVHLEVASSTSVGSGIAAVLLTLTALWVATPLSVRSAVSPETLCLAVVLIVATHTALLSFWQPFDIVRGAASLVSLSLVVLGGCALGRILLVADSGQTHRALVTCFGVLFVVGALPTMGIRIGEWLGAPTFSKPVFPFTEPSLFALLFTPFLMYRCVSAHGWQRVLFVASGFVLALLLENLTLVVGAVLVTAVTQRLRHVVLVAVVLLVFASQLDVSYYLARVDVADAENQNLSMLVYLQGWQLLASSISQSSGWGVGFQQMGLRDAGASASETIFALTGFDLNLLDGSFTAAKILSEFGVVGAIALLAYATRVARAFVDLRRIRVLPAATFASCVLVASAIELVVRGSGYFGGALILVIASLWLQHVLHRLPRRHAAHIAIGPAVASGPV